MKSSDIQKQLAKMDEKLNFLLEETGGELTADAEAVYKQIEELQLTAGEKIDRIVHVIDTVRAGEAGVKATRDYYKDLVKKYDGTLKQVSDKVDFLSNLIKGMVWHLPEKKHEKPDGKSLFIQEYSSIDDSEITDEERKILTEFGIGEKVVTYKVNKTDLKKALEDGIPNHEKPVQEILSKVYTKTTEHLRGL